MNVAGAIDSARLTLAQLADDWRRSVDGHAAAARSAGETVVRMDVVVADLTRRAENLSAANEQLRGLLERSNAHNAALAALLRSWLDLLDGA